MDPFSPPRPKPASDGGAKTALVVLAMLALYIWSQDAQRRYAQEQFDVERRRRLRAEAEAEKKTRELDNALEHIHTSMNVDDDDQPADQ